MSTRRVFVECPGRSFDDYSMGYGPVAVEYPCDFSGEVDAEIIYVGELAPSVVAWECPACYSVHNFTTDDVEFVT